MDEVGCVWPLHAADEPGGAVLLAVCECQACGTPHRELVARPVAGSGLEDAPLPGHPRSRRAGDLYTHTALCPRTGGRGYYQLAPDWFGPPGRGTP